jgi:phage/plasmid-like protein (TIGR03299 family)
MKVGAQIDKPVTAVEAARLGGLDFEVDLMEAGYLDSRDGIWKTTPNRKAVVRRDNSEWFEYVSDGYTPLQFGEAFSFMDTVKAHYVAAGTLHDGRQGYLVVDPDISIEPGGDPHKLYIVLRTSHDRSRGVEISLLPLARRCMNQLGLRLFANGAKQRWSIQHTASLPAKMHEARVVLDRSGEYALGYTEQVERLQLITPTEAQARDILGQVILHGGKKRGDEIDKIIELWHGDVDRVGFNDTAWGLVQAVSETLEWQRRSRSDNAESRFVMGLDGYTYKTVNRTTELVLAA